MIVHDCYLQIRNYSLVIKRIYPCVSFNSLLHQPGEIKLTVPIQGSKGCQEYPFFRRAELLEQAGLMEAPIARGARSPVQDRR